MPIDLDALKTSASRHEALAKASNKGPQTFAAVREALPMIRELRADGVSWASIAAALGEHGVMQGKGETFKPITRERLSAIVAQIEKAEQKAAQKRADRARRPDLTVPAKQKTSGSTVGLSPELRAQSKADDISPEPFEDEETIRRRNRDASLRFLKS